MSTFLRALSIRPAWAWLILHGGKDVENRSWSTRTTGPILIHASNPRDPDEDYWAAMAFLESSPRLAGVLEEFRAYRGHFPTGGIVGRVEITGCQINRDALEAPDASPWIGGALFGFTLANPEPLPFRACPGRLGFFQPDLAHMAAASGALTERYFR